MKIEIPKRLAWTALAAGSAMVAGSATRWLARRSWLVATDRDPRAVEDADVKWPEAIAWAAGSTAAVTAARLLARRSAAAGWRAVVGTPPPA